MATITARAAVPVTTRADRGAAGSLEEAEFDAPSGCGAEVTLVCMSFYEDAQRRFQPGNHLQ